MSDTTELLTRVRDFLQDLDKPRVAGVLPTLLSDVEKMRWTLSEAKYDEAGLARLKDSLALLRDHPGMSDQVCAALDSIGGFGAGPMPQDRKANAEAHEAFQSELEAESLRRRVVALESSLHNVIDAAKELLNILGNGAVFHDEEAILEVAVRYAEKHLAESDVADDPGGCKAPAAADVVLNGDKTGCVAPPSQLRWMMRDNGTREVRILQYATGRKSGSSEDPEWLDVPTVWPDHHKRSA